MRRQESKRIAEIVKALDIPKNAVCLNIGSSTKEFREIKQPHIDKYLFRPLANKGFGIIHCDQKKEEGVDLVGDVLDPKFQKEIGKRQADLLLCCNLLEHLEQPRAFASACAQLIRPGGYMIVTVPLSYPYHPDPIDTMLRLTPSEIGEYFPTLDVIATEILEMSTFLGEMRERHQGNKAYLRHLAKVLMPLYRSEQWLPNAHRLMWSFRRYKSSLVVFRRPSAT